VPLAADEIGKLLRCHGLRAIANRAPDATTNTLTPPEAMTPTALPAPIGAIRPQDWLGHRSIQHTTRYTQLSAAPFKDFWR
jgi:hypothetical protein